MKIPLCVKIFLLVVLKGSILIRGVLLHMSERCEKKLYSMVKIKPFSIFCESFSKVHWNDVTCAFGLNCHFANINGVFHCGWEALGKIKGTR